MYSFDNAENTSVNKFKFKVSNKITVKWIIVDAVGTRRNISLNTKLNTKYYFTKYY